ncbi:MAG: ATP-binding cassette domain-containing protein [Bacilli bacterium]
MTFYQNKNSSEQVVSLENASVDFGALHVFHNLNTQIFKGECVAVVGPSGCGKTTFLEVLGGFCELTEGILSVNEALAEQKPALMTQEITLFPWYNVIQNVALPLLLQGKSKTEAKEVAMKLLKQFGLEEFAHYKVQQLSGGMQQRLCFLRTHLADSPLVLLDEPFAKLDYITRQKIYEWLLFFIEQRRSSWVLVTHDLDEALKLADRILVFGDRPKGIVGEWRLEDAQRIRSEQNVMEKLWQVKQEIVHCIEQHSELNM